MTDLTEQGGVHPRVARHFKWVRLAVVLTFVLLALAAVIPFLVFYDEFKDDVGFYLLSLVLPLAIAGVAVLAFVRYWIAPKFKRMSGIMNRAQPMSMTLRGLGSTLRRGEHVELLIPGPDGALETWGVVWVKTPGDGAYFRKGQELPADVYLDQASGDRFVVLDTEWLLLWGRLEEKSPE